jgi:hypothetical protein
MPPIGFHVPNFHGADWDRDGIPRDDSSAVDAPEDDSPVFDAPVVDAAVAEAPVIVTSEDGAPSDRALSPDYAPDTHPGAGVDSLDHHQEAAVFPSNEPRDISVTIDYVREDGIILWAKNGKWTS